MQQRMSTSAATATSTTVMAEDSSSLTGPPSSRARHNSKLKLLGRSHAMREEASPPRVISPSIKVIPSPPEPPSSGGASLTVYSPSPCVSPTSTLVASPNHFQEPKSEEYDDENYEHQVSECEDLEVEEEEEEEEHMRLSPKCINRNNKNKNPVETNNKTGSKKQQWICECSSSCNNKCLKQGDERNFNNNYNSNNNNNVQNSSTSSSSSNTLTVNRINPKSARLRQQSSSQGSFESCNNSPCLSRDSSSEYTDTSGTNLDEFIPQTLNRNPKDRAFLLRIEQELVNLAKDKIKTHYKFPPMSSYQRMLVHRCAAYFGMDHNIESSGKCVVVNKTKNTRIPEVEFKQHIKEDGTYSNLDEPRRSILKRDSNSIEDYNFKSPDRQMSLENRRSKSFEEREEEYEKVRRRIFNREKLYYLRQMQNGGGSHDDVEWSEMAWVAMENDGSRYKLQIPEHNRVRPNGKLIKVLSEESGETLRPCVAKSYSFGGYGGGLARGDSTVSTHSAGPRLLTKQDSGASSVSWRLSPSSSGYKSQSQMSESVTPSPTSTPHMLGESIRQDSGFCDQDRDLGGDARLIWAVTDIQNVPKGSLIIDPESCAPVKNEDGTLYHYDPSNPPPGVIVAAKPPPSPKKVGAGKDRSQSPPPLPLVKSRPNDSNNNSSVTNNINNNNNNNKVSPSHSSNNVSHVTNSSTSPTLPYSPPLQAPVRNFQFVGEPQQHQQMIQQQQQQQQFNPAGAVYNSNFPPPPAQDTMPLYQQPCIVYTTPYGVQVSPHFDTRLESQQMGDLGGYYVNISDTSAPPPAYQQPAAANYWNQQQPIQFYQNQPPNPTPPQHPKFPPPPQQAGGYLSYPPQAFLPPPQPQNAPPPPAEMVFPPHPAPPPQPVHVVYPAANQQSVYANQIYAQSAGMYGQPPAYPQYPPNTSTPNNCADVGVVVQGMSQMGLFQGPPGYNKIQRMGTPKNKFTATGRSFGHQGGSNGTNSPAGTVYCPQAGMYRTPPETPPTPQFGYAAGYPVQPMLFRQFSNRSNTPGTTRSSRSPTPANEIVYFDRQRIPLTPAVYPAMPFVLQTDNRLVSGRGQPSAYHRQPPVSKPAGADSKTHKNRKAKGSNKATSGAGKPQM